MLGACLEEVEYCTKQTDILKIAQLPVILSLTKTSLQGKIAMLIR